MSQVDDIALVRRARAGEEAAFGELMTRHQGRVYHHALRLMGTAEGMTHMVEHMKSMEQ